MHAEAQTVHREWSPCMYGSEGLLALGKEPENRSCSLLACISLPPLLQLPALTEIILMTAENSRRKKKKVIVLCEFSELDQLACGS